MEDTEFSYGKETLEAAPTRVTRFLAGLGGNSTIRTILAERANMTREEIEEGCALLMAVLAQPEAIAVESDTQDAKAQRSAVAELDAWDEPAFARYGATLERHHPAIYEYVFAGGLAASTGAAAVAGIAKFLKRIETLADGSDPARAASKKEDREAVKLLEKRGLTKAERNRLEKLVATALGPTAPLSTLPSSGPSPDRMVKLARLKAWHDEWSTAARAVLNKRSHMIALGLAQRRVRPNEGNDDESTAAGTDAQAVETGQAPGAADTSTEGTSA